MNEEALGAYELQLCHISNLQFSSGSIHFLSSYAELCVVSDTTELSGESKPRSLHSRRKVVLSALFVPYAELIYFKVVKIQNVIHIALPDDVVAEWAISNSIFEQLKDLSQETAVEQCKFPIALQFADSSAMNHFMENMVPHIRKDRASKSFSRMSVSMLMPVAASAAPAPSEPLSVRPLEPCSDNDSFFTDNGSQREVSEEVGSQLSAVPQDSINEQEKNVPSKTSIRSSGDDARKAISVRAYPSILKGLPPSSEVEADKTLEPPNNSPVVLLSNSLEALQRANSPELFLPRRNQREKGAVERKGAHQKELVVKRRPSLESIVVSDSTMKAASRTKRRGCAAVHVGRETPTKKVDTPPGECALPAGPSAASGDPFASSVNLQPELVGEILGLPKPSTSIALPLSTRSAKEDPFNFADVETLPQTVKDASVKLGASRDTGVVPATSSSPADNIGGKRMRAKKQQSAEKPKKRKKEVAVSITSLGRGGSKGNPHPQNSKLVPLRSTVSAYPNTPHTTDTNSSLPPPEKQECLVEVNADGEDTSAAFPLDVCPSRGDAAREKVVTEAPRKHKSLLQEAVAERYPVVPISTPPLLHLQNDSGQANKRPNDDPRGKSDREMKRKTRFRQAMRSLNNISYALQLCRESEEEVRGILLSLAAEQ